MTLIIKRIIHVSSGYRRGVALRHKVRINEGLYRRNGSPLEGGERYPEQTLTMDISCYR